MINDIIYVTGMNRILSILTMIGSNYFLQHGNTTYAAGYALMTGFVRDSLHC